jgi:predicted ArsR family transcriptional regulator
LEGALSTSRPEPSNGSRSWDRLHLLSEPTRRRVFEAVRRADRALTRDEVSAQTGVNRRLVSFHLDRLADAGLLRVGYARPAGRSGPGAGRPAKQFTAEAIDVDITIPPRRYDIAARLLAEAIDTANIGDDVKVHALRIAEQQGRRIGELRASGRPISPDQAIEAAMTALTDLGYEPELAESGDVRLRNCPFDAVVDVAPGLVCDANVRLVDGLLSGLGADALTARLVGPCDGCCVAVEAIGPKPVSR